MAAPAAAERLTGRRRHLRYALERDRVLGSIMLFPSVAYLAALVGYPLVLVFIFAFSDASTSSSTLHFTGFDTFIGAIRDPVFLTALKNTFLFTFVSQALVVVFAFILANILSANFRGKWFVRFLLLLPWTTPLALSAVAWLWMLDPQFSPLDWILSRVHVIGPHHYVAWLGQAPLVQGSIIAIDAWRLLPLATVIALAGLTSIPHELNEQAEIDGAGFWRKLFGVTVPLLTPILMVAVLFGIVATFTDMAAVYILTNGGPNNATQVLPNWAFTKGIEGGDLGGGAATALFMFPVLLALAILMLRRASRADVA